MASRGRIIPFPRASPPPKTDGALVEVRRCDPAEAVVIKGLLESEGIPTLLRSPHLSSVHPFSVGDQGAIVVLVPESEFERSHALLGRVADGDSG